MSPSLLTVVFLQVSTRILGEARKSRDDFSGLSIALNKDKMEWGNTNQAWRHGRDCRQLLS